ncbi:MAG: nucleotidyltransferase domain-containing protein [Spirochaetales bacterium]|nr:nucleotidyltransferase domain-containing protein [Spirochaetales bacterium]
MKIEVPSEFRSDLEKAYNYLISVGCTEVFLFGSLAENTQNSQSDIDLAVRGLEKKQYFRVYGELLGLLSHPFDLIGLDYDNDFSREILSNGSLKRVS